MVHPVPGGVSRGAPSNGRGPVHGRRVKAIKEASSVISSSCANMTRGVACRGRDSVVWSSTISPYTWQLPGTCVQRLSTCRHLPIPPGADYTKSQSGGNQMCGGGLTQPCTCFAVYYLFLYFLPVSSHIPPTHFGC